MNQARSLLVGRNVLRPYRKDGYVGRDRTPPFTVYPQITQITQIGGGEG